MWRGVDEYSHPHRRNVELDGLENLSQLRQSQQLGQAQNSNDFQLGQRVHVVTTIRAYLYLEKLSHKHSEMHQQAKAGACLMMILL